MQNYPDSKCSYGYMTLCDECKKHAPKHVNTSEPIGDVFPIVRCEMCKKLNLIKKGVVCQHN